jgi:hypothetical protein
MQWKMKPGDLLTLCILGMFVFALIVARDWPLRASVIVFVLGGSGVLLVLGQLVVDYRARKSAMSSDKKPEFELAAFDKADPRATRRGDLEMWGWILGLLAGIRLFGIQVSVPLFVLAYSRVYGARWWVSVILGLFTVAFILGLYEYALRIWWPEPLLWELFKKFLNS